MGWIEVGFGEIELVNAIEGVPFATEWFDNMKLYRRDDVPADTASFKLVRLTQREGWSGLNVHLIDEGGYPLVNVAACQGWFDGPVLAPGSEPKGGQPEDRPNAGHAGFTNENGDLGFGWGPGEQFKPWETQGPHWYWVMGQWTDVPCGFGWWFGTNHRTIEPTFQRVAPGGNPPGDQLDRIEGYVLALATQIEELRQDLGTVLCYGGALLKGDDE